MQQSAEVDLSPEGIVHEVKLNTVTLYCRYVTRSSQVTTKQAPIKWWINFRSAIERVYEAIACNEGRTRFWAESALWPEGSIETPT